ncbi:hypothetical protein ElyMa_005505700 [Elysia marginata]|uniref:Uncharacterized protein n=1 Tax=Elysia marginata TaxID=1093978 RepID=A0AAV4EUF6_9GAST|nr:hypothetical protein ElyMa_005505700 [Elysia marginata]
MNCSCHGKGFREKNVENVSLMARASLAPLVVYLRIWWKALGSSFVEPLSSKRRVPRSRSSCNILCKTVVAITIFVTMSGITANLV